jgi:hypothetical protein
LSAQKIVFERSLFLPEARPEPGDSGKIRDDDGEIEWPQCDFGDCNNPDGARSRVALCTQLQNRLRKRPVSITLYLTVGRAV